MIIDKPNLHFMWILQLLFISLISLNYIILFQRSDFVSVKIEL